MGSGAVTMSDTDTSDRTPTGLMIGVPTMGTVHTRLTARLLEWARAVPRDRLTLHFTEHYVPIDRARNAIVEHFLHRTDASHLFMIDSDMIPPLDAPDRLAAHGKDFVTGMTPLPRVDPATGQTIVVDFAFAFTGPGEAQNMARPLPRDSGLQRISRCGGGCMMMHRAIFERLAPPWFRCAFDDGQTAMQKSADSEFCDRLRAAGVELWADTGVICRHQRTVLL
jgi:hypothetical protein